MASADTDLVRLSAEGPPSGRAELARRADPIAIVTPILIAVGIVLRVWQYVADLSLSSDELSIARDLHERSLTALMMQPLGSGQLAPPGFLASVKVSTLLFGGGDQALRLVPFLCGIVGLFLFWRVAARILNGAGIPIAVGLFALAIPLVRCTAEVTPSGLDVVATLVLTLVALELRARPATVRQCVLAGVAGLAIAWFSHAAILVMAGLGAALILCWLWERDTSALRPVLITVPVWALASLAGLLVVRRSTTPDALASMHAFWRSQGSFAPRPPSLGADSLWAWDRIAQFFADVSMLRYPRPILYAILTIGGFALIWRRRDVALILLGPVVVTFVAAVAQAYPFDARVMLFLLPSVLIVLAETIDVLLTLATSVHPRLGAGALVALAAPPIYTTIVHPPPYSVESFKPVLASAGAHSRSADIASVRANAYGVVDHDGP